MTIKISQQSSQQSPKRWSWEVWVDGSDSELNQISSVVYQLHETFPNPIRTVTDRSSAFKLRSAGWGEFLIYITLNYNNGQRQKLTHWLRLNQEDAKKTPAVVRESSARYIKSATEPTVFISSSTADTAFKEKIKQAIERKGARVLTQDDIFSDYELRSLMDQADIGVAILSKNMSPWIESEVHDMINSNTPVIPLIRAMESKDIPDLMRGLKGIPVYDDSDADSLAVEILNLGAH